MERVRERRPGPVLFIGGGRGVEDGRKDRVDRTGGRGAVVGVLAAHGAADRGDFDE